MGRRSADDAVPTPLPPGFVLTAQPLRLRAFIGNQAPSSIVTRVAWRWTHTKAITATQRLFTHAGLGRHMSCRPVSPSRSPGGLPAPELRRGLPTLCATHTTFIQLYQSGGRHQKSTKAWPNSGHGWITGRANLSTPWFLRNHTVAERYEFATTMRQ
jgi:hypothetical protein